MEAVKQVVQGLPSCVAEAVLVPSEEMPAGSVTVCGYDFNQGIPSHWHTISKFE